MHIPKILKILIPILIIISTVINPFAGVFNVRVEAMGATAGIGLGLSVAYMIANAVSYAIENSTSLEYEFHEAVVSYYGNVGQYFHPTGGGVTESDCPIVVEQYYDSVKNEFVVTGVSPNPYYIPVIEVDSDSVQRICDSINNSIANGRYLGLKETYSGTYSMSLESYFKMREDVVNGVYEKSFEKYVESVGGAVGDGTPVYEGSLFGPLASIAFPALSYSTGQIKDGFYFSPTVSSSTFFQGRLENSDTYYWYATANSAIMSPYTSIKEFMKKQLNGVYEMTYRVIIDDGHNHYGTSFYVIYNNEIYYNGNCKHNTISNDCYSLPAAFNNFSSAVTSLYCTVDGKNLELAPGASFKVGVCINLENPGCYYPSVADVPEDNTEMGEETTVEIPRSEDEETIANAIGVGLINENSPVTLDSEGNIAQVDGITLDKLNEILELIKEGNLDFENVQEYLNLITKLLSSGNLTAKQQEVLLDNINDSIKELTDGLTADDDYTLDIPEFGEIEVTAGGLDEVVDTVDVALPIVGQAKELITNLFNWGNYSSSTPPNFNFYWDSNKDGVVEKYCWLNLSFMETKLTNTNLEDKGRFRKQMTVREFLQSLIVLVIYALFAIKVLRKLPGLIGAGESGTDDIAVIDNYTRRH